jgi:Circadian oscillating protein COP23
MLKTLNFALLACGSCVILTSLTVLTSLTSGAIAQVPIETDTNPTTPSSPRTFPSRTIPNSPPPSTLPRTSSDNRISTEQRFSCQIQNGRPTVMYQPKSQQGQFFPWAVPSVMGGGWSSERRCSEIARRLEQYRPDGLLEMQTGMENGLNVVCATTDRNPNCRIVLTVPEGRNPTTIRDQVFGNLTTADSGQATVGVNTFVEGNRSSLGGLLSRSNFNRPRSTGIELKPFLDANDGGTGANLGGGIPARGNGLRFRPNNF